MIFILFLETIFYVLISRAQDYLMTTYIFKDMVEEICTLYKVIKNK